jgi:hypothetical protein
VSFFDVDRIEDSVKASAALETTGQMIREFLPAPR